MYIKHSYFHGFLYLLGTLDKLNLKHVKLLLYIVSQHIKQRKNKVHIAPYFYNEALKFKTR